jgi:glucose/arabinose dehydrogenase/mono/diheme cytochrome c family protein
MEESVTVRRFLLQLAGLLLTTGVLVAAVAILSMATHTNDPEAPTTPTVTLPPGVTLLRVETVAQDLRAPWGIAFLPDGRALVTERPGRVRLVRADRMIAPEPVLIVPDVLADTKLGLMGVAIDPDFDSQPYVYAACGYRDGEGKAVRVSRYQWTGEALTDPRTLLEGIPAQFNHSGGRLRFGPDKTLYITTGDADQPPLAQDLNSLGGKILRINRDGSIPDDNPFVDREDARPEVFSYGHRNPQGLDFQPSTGKLLATEHGPNGGDEINWVEAGANYGWPTITHDATADGLQSPLVQFTPSIAPASGVFYNGDLFKQLRGDYLVGCLRGEALLRVQLYSDGRIAKLERWLFARYGRVRDVVVAPDGAIWITTSMFDPPEAHGAESFDQVLRITPGDIEASATESNPSLLIGDAAVGLPPQIPLGRTPEERYAALCASCHGADLRGGLHPALVGKPWARAASEEELIRLIAGGFPDRGMPGSRPLINDDGCRELAQWLWGLHIADTASNAPAAAP